MVNSSTNMHDPCMAAKTNAKTKAAANACSPANANALGPAGARNLR